MPPERAVRIQENPPPAAWERYVRNHPDASLFHGLAWQRALGRAFPSYRPYHQVAWRGENVCGILLLHCVPLLLFGCALISTPLGLYGGVCADDDEVAFALLEAGTASGRSLKARYVELRHERPLGSLPIKDLYVTFRCESHADPEVNLKAIPPTKRRCIRVAQRHGLTFRAGGMELLPQFYDIYSKNMRNLGSPAFPRQFLEALIEEHGTQCVLFGVFEGDTMHSGALAFIYRDRIIPHYIASTPGGMKVSTNEFMYWKITCYAGEHGFKLVEFGRSKKGSGSYQFKHYMGCTAMPLAYQYQLLGQREIPNLSPANPRFALAIQAWRLMPFRLTRWLGPKVSRYFP